MKNIEAKGKCPKNKPPITKKMYTPLIGEFIMHAKNWVQAKHNKNTADSYLLSVLRAAINQYLKSPATYCQWRCKSELVQQKKTHLKTLKSEQQQHLTNSFCVKTILSWLTYHDNQLVIE